LENQSPIFTKSYDLTVWLLNHTEKFPKIERFRLAKRIEDAVLSFYELLIKAVRRPYTRQALLDADIELDKLRLHVRLAHHRALLSDDQYRYVSSSLLEVGRLLGGWIKSSGNSESGTFAPG
jgi:four helix bundle protein